MKDNDWRDEEIKKIAIADDLKISPFREDGKTYGTPTWIWSVVVDDALYVRAYYGQNSKWYNAATKQKAGRVHVAALIKDVTFQAITGVINNKINEAYKIKYMGSPYLSAMIGDRARGSTIKVTPADIQTA